MPRNYVNYGDGTPPEGYVYLAIVPNYWGKGETPRAAFAQCAKSGASSFYPYQLYIADPAAALDDTGLNLIRPTAGKAPILFASGGKPS